MRRRSILKYLIATASGGGILGLPVVKGQNARNDWKNLYSDVRDTVFPVPQRPPESLAMVVIRFHPSFSAESQLVLNFTKAGGDAEYVRLSEPLAVTLERVWPAQKEISEIAKKVEPKKTKTTLDAKVADRLLAQLWDALSKSPNRWKERLVGIQLDGTHYDVWIYTDHFSIDLALSDAEAYDDMITGDAAIVRWANTIRLSLAK